MDKSYKFGLPITFYFNVGSPGYANLYRLKNKIQAISSRDDNSLPVAIPFDKVPSVLLPLAEDLIATR